MESNDQLMTIEVLQLSYKTVRTRPAPNRNCNSVYSYSTHNLIQTDLKEQAKAAQQENTRAPRSNSSRIIHTAHLWLTLTKIRGRHLLHPCKS